MAVYFIQEGNDGPVKVGFSETREGVERRFRLFRTGNPHDLRLVKVVDGPMERERDFHAFLTARGLHIRGEWFECDEALAQIIWDPVAEAPHDWAAQYAGRLPPWDIGICWPADTTW